MPPKRNNKKNKCKKMAVASRMNREMPHIHATIDKKFPNHPLTEKENEDYDLAIWFYREALGYHLKENAVHTPSQKRSIIEMMESIMIDTGVAVPNKIKERKQGP